MILGYLSLGMDVAHLTTVLVRILLQLSLSNFLYGGLFEQNNDVRWPYVQFLVNAEEARARASDILSRH